MNKILFVVDERKNGGASKVLEMIFNNIPKLKADILVLHDNGDRLKHLKNANVIFGSSFFDTCDLSLKQLIKEFKIIKIIKKLNLIFLMKTGLIKYSIKKQRKLMNLPSYDIEISFKDGFGTYFVAYGDSKNKIRWLHNDYSMNDPGKHYKKSYQDAIKEFDKVVAIGKCAFDGCELLESINIPASVKQIGEYAFRLCIQLKEVVFADNSMLTSIDPGAFTSCEELTSITIPKGVTTISRDVFINCRNLTSVTIQSSVTNIDMQAFHNCIDLTTVYYTGTEEQWNNIVIGENNEYLLNANIVFNYTGEEK